MRAARWQYGILGLVAVATLVFWVWPLDLAVAGWFWRPGEGDGWPIANRPIWDLLYRAAPFLTGFLGLVSLFWIWQGLTQPDPGRPRVAYGLLLLATVVLGPGLLVNLVGKDHWGRPRPRQVEAFGGTMPYLPPLAVGESREGKSFPCGHCSIAFAAGALGLAWRRRRPGWAAAAFAGSMALGLLVGISRLAAGAHFLSDILWAWILTLGPAWVMYRWVLRIPQREETGRDVAVPRWALVGIGLLAAAMVLGMLLASPAHENLAMSVTRAEMPSGPKWVSLEVDRGDVRIVLADEADPVVDLRASARGFGLPWNKIIGYGAYDGGEAAIFQYRLACEGWFTELESRLVLRVDEKSLEYVLVNVREGDIELVREDAGAAPARGEGQREPVFDLRVERGEVRRSPAAQAPTAGTGAGVR